MIISFFELLNIINNREKFFQDKYIILSGKVFPYYFFQHFKKIISKKYNINKWIEYEDFSENNILYELKNNFLFYIEEKTIDIYDQIFGIIFLVSSESALSIFKKKIESIKQRKENLFFFIFLTDSFVRFFPQEKIFNIDVLVTKDTVIFLENHIKIYFEKNFIELFFYIVNFLVNNIKYAAHIEYIFYLLQYVLCLKKNIINKFIVEYTDDNRYYISSVYSIFELVTFFFQKKQNEFFASWFQMKNLYAEEFWLYFWYNQIWYAFLVLHYKKSNQQQEIEFKKKVNKWFLNYGILSIKKVELKKCLVFLYNLENNNKIHNVNILLHLESFFLLFISDKL